MVPIPWTRKRLDLLFFEDRRPHNVVVVRRAAAMPLQEAAHVPGIPLRGRFERLQIAAAPDHPIERLHVQRLAVPFGECHAV